MTELFDLDLDGASTALARGDVSARALLDACLARIEQTRDLGTFLAIDEKGARAAADASDARRAHGEPLSALDGVPVALKDLIVTEGLATTAGSKMLAGWVPPYDGAMSTRLKAAGAVVVGKTNLDEFAMGSSNEHSAFGPAKNPWDPTKVPGGSSGGSAAAVAAGQVFGALGTDTGGSIRQPAALCGVFGLKPTYGRVSRFGVIAFASSLDQIGPFGRSTRDVAHQLQVIAGHDVRDSTSADVPVPDYGAALGRGVKGLRVGVPAEYFGAGLDAEVDGAVRAALDVLRALGAELVPVSLPHTRYALSTYYVIATAEASSNLARYDGVRYGHRANERELRRMYAASRFEGFGDEVKRRIVLGTYVLSAGYYDAYYGKAQRVRTLIRRDFEAAFRDVDVLATPTSPFPAFGLGERTKDPLAMYLADVATLAVNLAGIPGLSVPAGFTKAGLPIGLQLLGRWFEEDVLLQTSAAFEAATPHAKARPKR
ncbi:Asp-tRNA(Asn)/Glu-tRNA(Gln) amidotransferase subunit GatA [Myxococcota bacterium]|nr:Asp-tRNA(Asn)/Glu-tRNA(Gln) amidotransferase subunit GatA [Myxococcota bacterium]